MGLKNAPVDSKGIIALLSTPFAFVPIGIGAPQLPTDEQAIVASITSLGALLGPLVPDSTSGTGVTVPTSLNNLWLAPTTGLDTNDGLTSLTPVKTMAKINAILGPYPVFGANFTLHITEAISEKYVLDWGIGATGLVIEIAGTETIAVSTVLTGVTNRVKATNTRQAMTDGATNWTASIGKIVRDATAGARLGSAAVVLTNNGGGAATVSTWVQTNESTITGAPTETLPIVGDTVTVLDSLAMSGQFLIRLSGLIKTDSKFFMRGFKLTAAAGATSAIQSDDSARAYLVDCVVNCPLRLQNVQLNNCFEDTTGVWTFVPDVATTFIYGGAGVATLIGGGSNVSISLGFVQIGLGLIVSDAGTLVSTDDLAVYDWTAAPGAVTVRRGANFVVTAAAAVWGNSAVANTPVLVVTENSVVQNVSGTTFILAIPALGTTVPSTIVSGLAVGYPNNTTVGAGPLPIIAYGRVTAATAVYLFSQGTSGPPVLNGAGDWLINLPANVAAPAATTLATGNINGQALGFTFAIDRQTDQQYRVQIGLAAVANSLTDFSFILRRIP